MSNSVCSATPADVPSGVSFRTAQFGGMDKKQLERVGSLDAAIQQWTSTFMQRIREVRTVQNCPGVSA